mmetsp:Transcript_23112/g.36311  ORF Transcript_23112/g.36311 Transcript_23112/m.36311 type:complete len:99 (+) Transcript_23112:34-330(+)
MCSLTEGYKHMPDMLSGRSSTAEVPWNASLSHHRFPRLLPFGHFFDIVLLLFLVRFRALFNEIVVKIHEDFKHVKRKGIYGRIPVALRIHMKRWKDNR